LLFQNVTVVGIDKLQTGRNVLCRHGRVEAFLAPDVPVSGDVERVDGGGGFLVPGFIDLHIHGSGNFLVDNGPDALLGLCRLLPSFGTTGFLPTVCPRPKGEDSRFLASLAAVRSDGAEILGFHLEGPFLTLTGALPADALGQADPERVRALRRSAAPHRAVFSVSPDFAGILDLLPLMCEGGIPAFMTHTRCTSAQAMAAIDAGVRHATHFYDVFPVPPETEPGARPCGAVEAALADPRVSVDFILDGEHVEPVAVRLALACKGPDRVCLITDANMGAGLPPGRFTWAGGEEIVFAYPGGPARLGPNTRFPGGLAGSGLTMDRAVRNALRLLALELPQAVRLASLNPAQVLGLDKVKGRVAPGYDADLVLLDRHIAVRGTWVGGERVFAAPPESQCIVP
jgi:N-acetylglucosamine-6-phosphate deacetylase